MKPPCRGCPERESLCHASCPKYLKFRAEKDRECAERVIDWNVRDAHIAAIRRQSRPSTMRRRRGNGA